METNKNTEKIIYEGEACTLVRAEDGYLELRLLSEASSLSWNWLDYEVDRAREALEEE